VNQAALKRGPLTQAELLLIWSTVAVDERSYAAPLVTLGEGYGLEVFTQMLAQLARTSRAIDRTIQASYILPHSSQSSEPASGAQNALVDLTFTRADASRPLILGAGQVWYDEVQTDSGETGPVQVITGRRYTLVQPLVMAPGEAGPLVAQAIAERPGFGYNNPQPGTIHLIETHGAELTNSTGALTVSATSLTLTLGPDPDVLQPSQVGEYVEFLGTQPTPLNVGLYSRISSYRAPIVGVDGGQVQLERLFAAENISLPAFVGRFTVGDAVSLVDNTGVTVVGTGVVIAARMGVDGVYRVVYTLSSGIAVPGDGYIKTITAAVGVFMAVTLATYNPTWVDDPRATWSVMSFEADLGVSVTNTLSPAGGRSPMLDMLGAERAVNRVSGEPDASYRQRVAQVADVVSPNAILRGANRVLAPLGVGATLREVGSAMLPGFFFDDGIFAYDMDPALNAADTWKVWLSFPEMRAFFLLGVPRICTGDFGLFYDGSSGDMFPRDSFYDDTGATNFTDGYSVDAAPLYQALWAETDERRAGGVSFDLYQLNANGV
jgi:hypothetical protein